MALIRPVLTDFSLGEVDPRLAGRVDLALASSAAEEITNAHTYIYGGVYKRGGLQYKDLIDEISTGEYRIIPWSIDHDTDVLLILSDKKIRYYHVGTDSNGFIRDSDNEIIETNMFSWSGVVIDAYSEKHIYEVQYVTDKNSIYLVHREYPPTQITIDTYLDSEGDKKFTISQKGFTLVSNILKTPEPPKVKTTNIQFSSDTVISALKGFVSNFSLSTETKEFTTGVSGSLDISGVAKTITKILIKRESRVRSCKIGSYTLNDLTPDGTVATIFSTCGVYIGTGIKDKHEDYWKWFMQHVVYDVRQLQGYIGKPVPTANATSALNFIAQYCVDTKTYYITTTTAETKNDNRAPYYEVKYNPAYTLYTVEFYSGSDKILTMVSNGTSTANGWFDIESADISINGTTSVELSAMDVINSLSPWLLMDKEYECPPGYTFCGKEPSQVVKTLQGDKMVIVVRNTNGQPDTVVDKTMTTIAGRLAVRLLPIISKNDWPGCIAIWQGRLIFGGSKSRPNVLYMSKSNDFFDFTFFEDIEYTSTNMKPEDEWDDPNIPEYETKISVVQQTGADSAIQLSIVTEENEEIKGVCGSKDLFINTTTSEFMMPAGTTALNITIQMVSRNGGSNIEPRFIQDTVTYINESRKRLFTFSPEQQIDLMQYAKHMINKPIIQYDYRSDPDLEIYITLENGTVLMGSRSEAGISWQRYTTANGIIRSCAVIRAADEDAVYMVVERFNKAYLERLHSVDIKTFSGRNYLDCSITKSSDTQFGIIENALVPIPVGKSITIHYKRKDLSEGEYTITRPAADIILPFSDIMEVHVGIPFTMVIKTWRLDSADTEGVAKNVESIFFRLYESFGFTLVKDDGDTFNVPLPTYDGVDQITYSGIIEYDALSPWSLDKNVHIKSENGYAVNILNIMPQMAIGEVI